MRILVINLGATSSKIAVYEDEKEILVKSIAHTDAELTGLKTISEQGKYREEAILRTLQEEHTDPAGFDAVISRGGPLRPVESGTYLIDSAVLKDASDPSVGGRHPACLGLIIASRFSERFHYPAYFADPVSTDELKKEARWTGLKGMHRTSMFHALNQKAVARKAAALLGRPYEEINLIGVHMGGGTSIAAHERGRVVDNFNIVDEGCFCMDRPGSLPTASLIELCYSGKYEKAELKQKIAKNAGVFSYLGTKDFLTMEKMIDEGNEEARRVYETMVYQEAKCIGAMAAAMHCSVDGIFLTGGIAHSDRKCADLEAYVGKIAPVLRLPGENEMESLAECALRTLQSGKANCYAESVRKVERENGISEL